MKVQFIKNHSFGIKVGEIKDIIEINALRYIKEGYCVALEVEKEKHKCNDCQEKPKGKKRTVCKECEEQRVNKK